MEAYSIKQWKDRNFRYFNQAYLGDCVTVKVFECSLNRLYF